MPELGDIRDGSVGTNASSQQTSQFRTRVAVVLGGEAVAQAVPPGPFDVVIAADSGLDLAEHLGWPVDLIVGDLDSVSSGALERARSAEIRIVEYPAGKDETDFELAMNHALELNVNPVITVVGGAGGRLDHLLANLAVIASPRWAALEITAWVGRSWIAVVRGHRHIAASPGAMVSLLAWHGDAVGVTTRGLEWELENATLAAGSGLGTSNRSLGDHVDITVLDGVLTATIDDITLVDPGLRVTRSNTPETRTPETRTPETRTPETRTPETRTPETTTPEAPA